MGPLANQAKLSKHVRYPSTKDVQASIAEPDPSSSRGKEVVKPPFSKGFKISDPILPRASSLDSVLAASPGAARQKKTEYTFTKPSPKIDEPFQVFTEISLQILVKIGTNQGKRVRDRIWEWWHLSGKVKLKFDAKGKITPRKLDYTKPFYTSPGWTERFKPAGRFRFKQKFWTNYRNSWNCQYAERKKNIFCISFCSCLASNTRDILCPRFL